MRIKRGGDVVGTLQTNRSFFPSADPTLGPVSRFFEGEATSEVGLRAGLKRDVWSTEVAERARPGASRWPRGLTYSTAPRASGPRQRRDRAGGRRSTGCVAWAYAANPPPATFRLIVSPLVSWIWIGALIVFAGGLITLWPPLRHHRSRSRPTTPLAWPASWPRVNGSESRRCCWSSSSLPWSCSWSAGLCGADAWGGGRGVGVGAEGAALEAAKEAKYAEIRDAELDHRSTASSPTRTGACRTGRCGPRRSRSCTGSTGFGPEG